MTELKPFIICGAPGGGTSFFTKFLRANAFYAGKSIEEGRANIHHKGWLERAKWHESLKISEIITKPLELALGIAHDDMVNPEVGPFKYRVLKKRIDNMSPEYWEKVIDLNKDTLLATLHNEFPFDGAVYGWKDPRNVYFLTFFKYLLPNAKIVTVERNMNPNPSNIGTEGKNFAAHQELKVFRDLYYSHYDDFRFQFEDFAKVEKVNELLTFMGLKTLTENKLKAQLKELKFMYSKI
jgi:hypothetical protein